MKKLYANVLLSSYYSAQRQAEPFPVHIEPSADRFWVKGGIGGQYSIGDLEYFILEDNKLVPTNPIHTNTALLERILAPLGATKIECDSEWLEDIAKQLRSHASKIMKASKRNAMLEAEERAAEQEYY